VQYNALTAQVTLVRDLSIIWVDFIKLHHLGRHCEPGRAAGGFFGEQRRPVLAIPYCQCFLQQLMHGLRKGYRGSREDLHQMPAAADEMT
jgi:hypothetical protein